MRKFILLTLILFIGIESYSQTYSSGTYTKAFTLGVDTKMLFKGPYPDRYPNPDKTSALHIYAQLILPQNENTEFGLVANYTDALDTWTNSSGQELSSYFNWGGFFNIKFLKWGEEYGNYHSKHTIYFGVEATLLHRPKLYYSIGSNGGYRFMFNEHAGVDFKLNLMTRPEITLDDEPTELRLNGVVSFIYYFDLYK